MNKLTEIVRFWLVCNLVFVAVYDYTVIVHFPKYLSISQQLRSLVDAYPALLVVIGTIGGHLFWRK
jgi:hypothetical protein